VLGEQGDFLFVQISDTHWGFANPQINPESAVTLKKEIALVNSMSTQPDFIIFTGDLTHDTEDDVERHKRLKEFREIVGELKVKNIRFMPGEHDAALDGGEAYREFFGDAHYSFDHKGIHFIALNNTTDPRAILGDKQVEWLASDLQKLDRDAPIVVFSHRPLFELYSAWQWYTRDGSKVIDMLMPFENVIAFHGHIHQENHHTTGHIAHHACKGSMYPLSTPGPQPAPAPVPWDAKEPFKGLGFRSVKADKTAAKYEIAELTVTGKKEEVK
jgi:3',5'-cyclic AMP phosphodiesterase CpdA